MATRMELWRLNEDGSTERVREKPLDSEEQIESMVESDPDLLGLDLLIIGRQTQTPSGPLDLLALDSDARLVVIENKRDRTPREVVAQVIDYAAWVSTRSFDQVEAIYARHQASRGKVEADLAEDFRERFGEPLESLGDIPRMIVVAAHLDDSTERMIDFLSDTFDVPVNAVLFQPFEGGLIGRTWLRADGADGRSSGRRSSSNAAQQEANRQFWAALLPLLVRNETLYSLGFAVRDVTSSYIRRDIVRKAPGAPKIPAALRFWVMRNSARTEIVFDGADRQLNLELFNALAERRTEIEAAYGGELDWDAALTFGHGQRSRSLRAAEVEIADTSDPSEDTLLELVDSASRLVDAVMPHLEEAFQEASASLDDFDEAGGDDERDDDDVDEDDDGGVGGGVDSDRADEVDDFA